MSYNIIEEIEYDPSAVIKVKKQLWDNSKQQFVPKTFLRYYRCTAHEIENDCQTLTEAYGPPRYQGMWWAEPSRKYIWLAESAATFWMLKNK